MYEFTSSEDIAALRSRDAAFSMLDGHAAERYAEIRTDGRYRAPVVKSYVIETVPKRQQGQLTMEQLLRGSGLCTQQFDDMIFRVGDETFGKWLGILERVSPRFLVLHTTEKVHYTDNIVHKALAASPYLDNMWVAGLYFDRLWDSVRQSASNNAWIRMKFESENRYETDVDTVDAPENVVRERGITRSAATTFSERLRVLGRVLPGLRDNYAPFHAMSMLRLPPAGGGKGGSDLHSTGKVTNWAQSFYEHRLTVVRALRGYEHSTAAIEEDLPVGLEPVPDGSAVSIRGSALHVKFLHPLSEEALERFLSSTIAKGRPPFRLWGQPIRISSRRYHVYGVDLHLLQQFTMEITPDGCVVTIGSGTCGNVVHRLIANIQQHLVPRVEATIGGKPYADYIQA
ncbi:hypothetical protein LLH23_13660 [bacterium]|nr:hypothetical protein [bacterium]